MSKHMDHFFSARIPLPLFHEWPDRQKRPAAGPSLPGKSEQRCGRSFRPFSECVKTSAARSSGSTKRQRLSTYTRISPLVCCSASRMAETILFFSSAEKKSFFEKNGIFNTWVLCRMSEFHIRCFVSSGIRLERCFCMESKHILRKYYSGNS